MADAGFGIRNQDPPRARSTRVRCRESLVSGSQASDAVRDPILTSARTPAAARFFGIGGRGGSYAGPVRERDAVGGAVELAARGVSRRELLGGLAVACAGATFSACGARQPVVYSGEVSTRIAVDLPTASAQPADLVRLIGEEAQSRGADVLVSTSASPVAQRRTLKSQMDIRRFGAVVVAAIDPAAAEPFAGREGPLDTRLVTFIEPAPGDSLDIGINSGTAGFDFRAPRIVVCRAPRPAPRRRPRSARADTGGRPGPRVRAPDRP